MKSLILVSGVTLATYFGIMVVSYLIGYLADFAVSKYSKTRRSMKIIYEIAWIVTLVIASTSTARIWLIWKGV